MAKFRKKPVIIDAYQWQPGTDVPGLGFIDWEGRVGVVNTLEGAMRVNPGDFIIRGFAGEFYPCRADIFLKTYEPIKSRPPECSICFAPDVEYGGETEAGGMMHRTTRTTNFFVCNKWRLGA